MHSVQNLEEGQAALSWIPDEPIKQYNLPDQLLYFLFRGRMLHVKDCLYFFWIHLDALLSDYESKKLVGYDVKGIFTRIQLHSVFAEGVEGAIPNQRD